MVKKLLVITKFRVNDPLLSLPECKLVILTTLVDLKDHPPFFSPKGVVAGCQIDRQIASEGTHPDPWKQREIENMQ